MTIRSIVRDIFAVIGVLAALATIYSVFFPTGALERIEAILSAWRQDSVRNPDDWVAPTTFMVTRQIGAKTREFSISVTTAGSGDYEMTIFSDDGGEIRPIHSTRFATTRASPFRSVEFESAALPRVIWTCIAALRDGAIWHRVDFYQIDAAQTVKVMGQESLWRYEPVREAVARLAAGQTCQQTVTSLTGT